jgi:hypothetical protein
MRIGVWGFEGTWDVMELVTRTPFPHILAGGGIVPQVRGEVNVRFTMWKSKYWMNAKNRKPRGSVVGGSFLHMRFRQRTLEEKTQWGISRSTYAHAHEHSHMNHSFLISNPPWIA